MLASFEQAFIRQACVVYKSRLILFRINDPNEFDW